jgi:alkylation response protein AidB-like acyl-CoA dehydrogenase
MRFVGQRCIQLHGGVGVTDECIASHCFKRLTMLEMVFGDARQRMQDTAGIFA